MGSRLFSPRKPDPQGQSGLPICGVRDSWLCLRLLSAELSVVFGAGVSLFCNLNIETGDPPTGWGVRRTISNKEFRTAEVFLRNETMFFTSIFCGSLFCGSAVHILKDLIADSHMQGADRRDLILRFCSPSGDSSKPGPPPHGGIFEGPGSLLADQSRKGVMGQRPMSGFPVSSKQCR